MYDVSKFRSKCQHAMGWADFEELESELEYAHDADDITDDEYIHLRGILELYMVNYAKLV